MREQGYRMIPMILGFALGFWSVTAQAQSWGFLPDQRLPIFTYFGPDNVRHRTDEFAGRWFVLKRGAAWCSPCVAERPYVDRFMRNHPEVPVLMGVVSPPPDLSIAAKTAQMQKDIVFNTARGWETRQVVVLEGRSPSDRELAAPAGYELLPLTIVVDSKGVVVKSWLAGSLALSSPLPFHEMLEAALICGGARLAVADGQAKTLGEDKAFCTRIATR